MRHYGPTEADKDPTGAPGGTLQRLCNSPGVEYTDIEHTRNEHSQDVSAGQDANSASFDWPAWTNDADLQHNPQEGTKPPRDRAPRADPWSNGHKSRGVGPGSAGAVPLGVQRLQDRSR